MRHRRLLLLGLAVGVALAGALCADRGATAPAKKSEEKERKVVIKSPTGTVTYQNDVYTATDAVIELPDSDAVMTASRIEYNDEEEWAKATGKPRLWDKQSELTADAIRVDLDARRADAEGSVRLVARPKEAKTDSARKVREKIKEPVVVTCDTMQYFYRDTEKRGTATGNLKITYKDKKADWTATGARLSYDGNEETVTLEGGVQFSSTRGEGGPCERVVIAMKEGAEGFRIEGIGTGGITFFVKEKEGEKGAKKPESDQGAGEKPPAAPE